jgi:spermidine synthase
MMQDSARWITFSLQPGEHVSYQIIQPLAAKRTRFQHIELLETATFGKSLFIDKKPQSSSYDHFIVNEALVHPALTLHPHPRRVFLAGVGPGSSLCEVLKHPSVEDVIVCDVDEEAILFYKEYMHEWHAGAFDDQRVRLICDDARACLAAQERRFDCIFVDVSDPLEGSPTIPLFTREFYALARERLHPGGIFVTQAGRTNVNNLAYHRGILWTICDVFAHVSSYTAHYPFYAESWGFVFASDYDYNTTAINTTDVDSILGRRACRTRFYDGNTHRMVFTMPKYLREELDAPRIVYTDASPLIVT